MNMTNYDSLLDVHPQDPIWNHSFALGIDGVRIHYVKNGHGPTLILLHGWPGFWYDWRRIIPRLSKEAQVIAPDFRGFGDSDKPDKPPIESYTPEVFAGDVISLLDRLGVGEVVIAAYDLGVAVARVLAHANPSRVRALTLFNPPYPGIGMRRFEPSAQRELWYQHFHNLP